MAENFDSLWQAYRATSYEADLPSGRVRIRLGEPCPGVDRQLQIRSLDSWAFITAFNPASQLRSPNENCQRHEQLQQLLDEFGHVAFSGAGVPDDPAWEPETSLLVLGIGRSEAVMLGRRFGQIAVVVGSLGSTPELVACG